METHSHKLSHSTPTRLNFSSVLLSLALAELEPNTPGLREASAPLSTDRTRLYLLKRRKSRWGDAPRPSRAGGASPESLMLWGSCKGMKPAASPLTSLVLFSVPQVSIRQSPPAAPVMFSAKICQNPCPVKSAHAEMLKQASKEQACSQKRGRNVV